MGDGSFVCREHGRSPRLFFSRPFDGNTGYLVLTLHDKFLKTAAKAGGVGCRVGYFEGVHLRYPSQSSRYRNNDRMRGYVWRGTVPSTNVSTPLQIYSSTRSIPSRLSREG